MKTKIVHYGAEEDIFWHGEYDQHDLDIAQGVYGKEDMRRFVSIVTKQFLTDLQRHYYFECVVFGKKVKEIAQEEGTHISNVYKHLRKAEMTICSIKELMVCAGGKKSILVLFQQYIIGLGEQAYTIATDYYLKGLSCIQIAKKHDLYLSNVNNLLTNIRNKAIYNGLTVSDLNWIRDYYKKGACGN